jgi:SAM-dependent methyltransferase
MQTPAEAHLINRLCDYLNCEAPRTGGSVSILNIGAGRSTVIENSLTERGCKFECDRIDVEDCSVELPAVRRSSRCSVEDMRDLEADRYRAAFANYVLEHVSDLQKAALEVFRVLEPGGLFIASVPNLTAPEFVIARHAPARFQAIMTRGKGFHTCYAWRTIDDLMGIFTECGFSFEEARFWAFTEGYLGRYPLLGLVSRLYDRAVSASGIKHLMGNVCVSLRKP